MQTISYDCRAKPIEIFCSIPKLGKHEHTKTLKILNEHESQFLSKHKPAFHFEQIWGEATTGEIYDKFARPAIADLFRGQSTLLFVTGRKKNHRNEILFGETKDTGILPLTINALYNSIGEHRAMKYFFRPLGSNRYRVQSEAQAMFERHQRDLLPKISKNVLGNLTQTSILEKSILDQTANVLGADEDRIYTVFVSAMEINSDFSHSTTIDLLKVFTEGFGQNQFDSPENCVEIEFDDARKTRRKLFDTNKIPTKENSTRLYTIRLVHGKKSEQIEAIVPTVSQLTFIDLPTGKNFIDLKILKDFIVPPKRRTIENVNFFRNFLNDFPLENAGKEFSPIKILLCASASSRDGSETLEDIQWLTSLQYHKYLVYLGREENEKEKERHVSRDREDFNEPNDRPPRPPPIHSARNEVFQSSTNFAQQVPNSTNFGQSTPRSVAQPPNLTPRSVLQVPNSTQFSQSTPHSVVQVPNSTQFSQSTPRSVVQIPNSNIFGQSTPRSVAQIPNSTQYAQSTPRSTVQVPNSTSFGQSTSNSAVKIPSTTSTLNSVSTSRDKNLTSFRSSSLSRTIRPTRSEEIFSRNFSPQSSNSVLSNLNPSIPPRIPIRNEKNPMKISTNEINVKNRRNFVQRRAAPPPPNVEQNEANLKIVPNKIFQTRREETKNFKLKEENLLKRSSSADRIGRERWLHHITDASANNNAIKLRTLLPNSLQLVSNHFNAMSKLLNATKYAIEHRDENKVQLFQGDVMATSKGGVKVVFTSMDQVTHTSLLPRSCDVALSGKS